MTGIKQEEQISHLKQLTQRNSGLTQEFEKLLSQYETLSSRNEQYKALLKEFGLEEGKGREQAGVKRFKMASMLYVVIHGFKDLAHCEDAQEQLDRLDEIFISIGDLAQKHGLVKIPTVGDNVLLAGGIMTENKTNPVDATLAALEIINNIKEYVEKTNCVWRVGIGIHTGPIIGRFAPRKNTPYTLSGNNVLTVSRLGRAAKEGEVVISPMTFELVREFVTVKDYGRIPVKYSGVMNIFGLEGLRPELVSDGPDMMKNEAFWLAYKRLQFMDIQEYMLDMLEEKLPKNLYYHNVKHTIDVTTEAELIGWAEGLDEKSVMLLKVAALFHDSGHIMTYKGHEEESCKFAEEILPRYNYSPEDIAVIKRIIMATQLPHEPADVLEAVIQDSDLDYLGRSDFIPVSNMLYKENTERGIKMTINEWNKIQIKFISSHQYYTNTAQSLREVNKQSQIERLKELVEECDREGIQ